MPLYSTLQRTIQRKRKAEQLPYPVPHSLAEIDIPIDLRITKAGQNFLFFDSGPEDEQRFFVFATNENLETLVQNNVWMVDGTFKVVPEMFYQLWSIHACVHGAVLPLVYVLMESKSQAMYTRVLATLVERYDFTPEIIILDFEKAALNALQHVFPNAKLHGCFFHLTQCVWRKLQQFGLSNRYKEDEGFRSKVKMLVSLAFVKEEHVAETFELMQDDADDELMQLMNYFEDTFIGRKLRRHRQVPRFAIKLWSCHEITLNGQPRTNNNVEGWHRAFQETINLNHPTVYKLVSALRDEQSHTEMRKVQLNAG